MDKYDNLVKILNCLREEAPQEFKSYYPSLTDLNQYNQAMSRAFIHLYMKVSFGLLNFLEREEFITDGTYDGGIDAYYIDNENKIVYFIQSKYRTTKTNFENKSIELDELLCMEIDRILEGHECYENGTKFNNKILKMVNRIREIEDIARYRYQIVLLANIKETSQIKLRKIFGTYHVLVFNYEKTYADLIFPLVSGTYFNASELKIMINISNKSTGAKISYTVETEIENCEITVLFVPALEIANIMLKYKNSILKYNPSILIPK